MRRVIAAIEKWGWKNCWIGPKGEFISPNENGLDASAIPKKFGQFLVGYNYNDENEPEIFKVGNNLKLLQLKSLEL